MALVRGFSAACGERVQDNTSGFEAGQVFSGHGNARLRTLTVVNVLIRPPISQLSPKSVYIVGQFQIIPINPACWFIAQA